MGRREGGRKRSKMIKEIARPKLKNAVLIVAWPGMGEVAYRTALFLKEVLPFKIFAKLEAIDFFKPAGVIVEKGVVKIPSLPAGFFYYYKNRGGNDIILFLGDAQPPLEHSEQLAKVIIEFLVRYKIKFVFSFAAKPEPIDHKTNFKIWMVATHPAIFDMFKKYNLNILSQGQISGLNGLILGVAKRYNLKGVCFLAEIPFYTVQIENPRANVAILRILSDYLGLSLNLTPLLERAKFIEEEIDKLISYLKGEVSTPAPLSEEDIEKIKKDLATYTKLPSSAREKIEALFKEAEKDISKAGKLKEELDKWNVYKEYEDRFLDLFKDKGNQVH